MELSSKIAETVSLIAVQIILCYQLGPLHFLKVNVFHSFFSRLFHSNRLETDTICTHGLGLLTAE